ncbi:MAG TPA: type IV toxin-antitoxin system AbiEi family antitoxin domain-containing protein [Pseudonocardia sp.]|nr:type IV toxin-antitoxin system AbiEi family antitoxin domain-containing protein [Pseudonocardia sp.]
MSKLAAVHGGVITAAQCRTLGVDDASVRRLLSAGLWTRARRGIYADVAFTPRIPEPAGPDPMIADRGVADPAHHAQCAALLACLARPAVVSHLSAARLLGLPLPLGPLDLRACVTRRAPAPTNDPLEGDVHVVDYDDADVLDVAGVPVLARARLVLDCCDVLPPDSALAVADAALARNLTTSTALDTALRRRRTRS